MINESDLLLGRLANRVQNRSRPLALIVGSALSQQDGRGVSSVKQIVQNGLATYGDVDPDQSLLRAVESSAVDIGEIYRTFMGRLFKFDSRAAADALVRDAVLAAWAGVDPPQGDGTSSHDNSSWQLTDGLVGLSELLAKNPGVIDVIVTTNFDPLIEVALNRAGVATRRKILTADGPIAMEASASSSEHVIDVVYVHGFWHKAPTMHTPEQLMHSRPRLQAAIVRAVEDRDALVMGYGGWDDVVTGALEALALDDGATGEVMWCFYESEEAVIQARHRTLLGRVGRLVIDGLFHRYSGIDCHAFLPALARRLDSNPATSVTDAPALPPRGWVTVDEALIAGARSLYSEQDLGGYFNGRSPDWALASSAVVPQLEVVEKICRRLSVTKEGESYWQFLLAAAGDGKSTALMQVAYRMHEDGWRVIWRPHPGIAVDYKALAAYANDRPTLLVVDDGDSCVSEMGELAKLLAGKSLHVLVGARLADWRNAGGETQNFDHVATSTLGIGRLTRREAREVIAAWSSIPSGLGKLAEVDSEEGRTDRLIEAVESDRQSNGSLLGGLFRLRFDKSSLDAHVSNLLDSLESHDVRGSHISLLKAFIYVCALEAGNVSGIDRRLWAELLGVDVKSLRRTAEFSLGTEAATARSGGIVQVRHPELARSALRNLRTRSRGIDLSHIYQDIVSGAISLGRALQFTQYSEVVHLPTRIVDGLQDVGYSREQAFTIAISAAESAISEEPDLLVYQTDLGSLLRKSGQPQDAIDHYIKVDHRLYTFRDYRRAASGIYHDWSLSYTDVGDPGSALLIAATGMTQHGRDFTRVEFGRYFVLLSRNLVRLQKERKSDRARLALAAIVRLGDDLLIPNVDLKACQNSADLGMAPSSDRIARAAAFQLLGKAITGLTEDCAAAPIMPELRIDLLEKLISPHFAA